ncbi:MAG TPA: glycosyltransferase family 39 protein [Thermoanaerobaculia bacterium]|nr:glycosyltransferase family 39 protein [Thermoanaerobaculia bacterium]
MDLTLAPEPLTARQRTLVVWVAIACALSRLLALARSPWDWDEMLFCLGMRDYDVTRHHPHPPGFPVYIGLAKLFRPLFDSDFRALQCVNLIAAALLFPAVFLLARELRFRFTTSVVAAALFAFFPNVWFFGGGAFSDVPSIVLVTFAAAFLFRGVRSRNAYWIGTLLLALAIGIRPQNLLIGLFPGIVATWKRKPHEIAIALLIGIVVCLTAYGATVYATAPFDQYLLTVRAHGDYISRVDSFRAPGRPPLWRLFDRFFIKQYQSPPLSVIVSLFVLISAIAATRARDRRIGFAALTFAPFAIFAWLMLDRFSISRFSIGYAPMFALLAADGIARVVRLRRNANGHARTYEVAIGAALILAFIAYTAPVLGPVRRDVSPPVQAVNDMMQKLKPRRETLYVGYPMVPFMEYLAPQYPFIRVIDDRALALTQPQNAWLLTELDGTSPQGFYFARDRNALWNIARRHFFEIDLRSFDRVPRFLDGWYEGERVEGDEWRWMSAESLLLLPPQNGKAKLRLILRVPSELTPRAPRITIRLNGKLVDRFRAHEDLLTKDYDDLETAPTGLPNTLQLTIDRTMKPGGNDPRELGLQLRSLSWGPQ